MEGAAFRRPMASPVDESALRRLAQELGGADVVDEIIDAFLTDGARFLPHLDGAEAEGERSFVRAAHTLKSSSSLLGAQALSDLCGRVEKLARQGQLAAARALLPEVRAELAVVTAELRARRGRL